MPDKHAGTVPAPHQHTWYLNKQDRHHCNNISCFTVASAWKKVGAHDTRACRRQAAEGPSRHPPPRTPLTNFHAAVRLSNS